MRIVFMGTPDFAGESLKQLLLSENEVVKVVTQPDRKRNRGITSFSPVKEIATENNIEVLQPEKVKGNPEFLEALKTAAPDLIVVVAFGQILPKEILELPKYGCVNVHASLLPKLRGASPIHHAILNGESITGISVMKMEEGLDSGPVYETVKTEIDHKNVEELHDELAVMGAKLLVKVIDDIKNGKAVLNEQIHEESSYAPIIKKADGEIDFNSSAEYIERKIRAFGIWPGAYSNLNGKTYKFYRASVSAEESKEKNGTVLGTDDTIDIKCGAGVIKISEIQAQGKKRMSTTEFLRGNSVKTGMKFE